jgi:hypothetical protein
MEEKREPREGAPYPIPMSPRLLSDTHRHTRSLSLSLSLARAPTLSRLQFIRTNPFDHHHDARKSVRNSSGEDNRVPAKSNVLPVCSATSATRRSSNGVTGPTTTSSTTALSLGFGVVCTKPSRLQMGGEVRVRYLQHMWSDGMRRQLEILCAQMDC